MCSLHDPFSLPFSGRKRGIFDEFGEEGLKRGKGDMYKFTRDAREMFDDFFAKMCSSCPDFVPLDGMPEGSFGGYMKPKKSQSKNSQFMEEAEEVELTGFVGMGMGENSAPPKQVPPKPPKQDPPIEHTLNLSLEELFSGCTKKMKISRNVLSANGSVSREDKILSIEVKPGWKQGTKVTFPQEGDQAVGRVPSNIIFVIGEKPHSNFKREGNDLRHSAEITLKTAICGGEVEIPHIDGLVMRYPLHGVVKPGQEDMYRGLGMPVSKQPGKRGDLLVNYNISFPEEILGNDKENLANILGKYY